MYANSTYIWLPLTLAGDVGAVLEATTVLGFQNISRIYLKDFLMVQMKKGAGHRVSTDSRLGRLRQLAESPP